MRTVTLDDYVLRGFRDGDEAQILPLFARSFHVERSLERWRWVYEQNPLGNRKMSLAFSRAGKLVAQYAGFPVRFCRPDESDALRTSIALQIGDLMSDRSVRHVGRGPTSLFGRTARHFYASHCEDQVAFNYGVSTGTSQKFGQRFLGVQPFEEVRYAVRDATLPFPSSWRTRLRRYRIERLSQLDPRFDELFERVRKRYGMLTARDAATLDRRYLHCPDIDYELWAAWRRDRLVGWSVFRRRNDSPKNLVWGDALFDPEEPGAIAALLARVLGDGGETHAPDRRVETWLARHPAWWNAAVCSLGFESAAEPNGLVIGYKPFLVDPIDDFRRHWYYTMGDFDLF